MDTDTRAEIDPRFSDPAAEPLPWSAALDRIRGAALWLLTTVRASGAPHVCPLLVVWHDGALHFCTGTTEQKHRNLTHSPEVVLAVGDGTDDGAMELVVEGRAARVTDEGRLHALAGAWVERHGEFWSYDVRDGAFHHGGGPAHVFTVAPRKVLAFTKDPHSAQMRWLPGGAVSRGGAR
jgi:nitroimidazol reductase NimA-like FMN-containing flavoprotein (pyridoxamine 5'-phosphate oxidase superfamily)